MPSAYPTVLRHFLMQTRRNKRDHTDLCEYLRVQDSEKTIIGLFGSLRTDAFGTYIKT